MKHVLATLMILALLFTAHAKAPEPVIANGEKIAFLGDSITQFGNRPDGYVRLVMDGLKRSGVNAICIPAGVSGNKSNDMLKRLPGVLQKKPDWLFLSCGVNDVGHGPRGIKLPDFKRNISAILDQCRQADVKVMILTPTMCGENPQAPNNHKLAAYCEFLRLEAAKRKLPLADLNQAMHEALKQRAAIKGLKLTIDNLHMNGYGNQMMATGILRRLGVPAAVIDDCHKVWNDIPSMTPILNAWYNPQFKISINDYERLYQEASKQKVSVQQLVENKIKSYVLELKER